MKRNHYKLWFQFSKICCVLSLLLIAGGTSASTTEARLHSDRISYTGPNKQVEVVLTGIHVGQIEVSVRFHDKVVKVPKRFMFDAKEIVEESLRLRVEAPEGGGALWTQALEKGFNIYFAFGGAYEHGTEEKPVEVYKMLMIRFEKGELAGVELAVPSGEFKNKWVYHYRYAGIMHKEGKEEAGSYDGLNERIHSWEREDDQ